jgi:hypothetical protein
VPPTAYVAPAGTYVPQGALHTGTRVVCATCPWNPPAVSIPGVATCRISTAPG